MLKRQGKIMNCFVIFIDSIFPGVKALRDMFRSDHIFKDNFCYAFRGPLIEINFHQKKEVMGSRF